MGTQNGLLTLEVMSALFAVVYALSIKREIIFGMPTVSTTRWSFLGFVYEEKVSVSST